MGIVTVLVAGLMLLGGGGVAVVFALRSPQPLQGTVVLDDQGKEQLALECPSCPDGSLVTLGTKKTSFKGRQARIELATPLAVGKNQVDVEFQPLGGRPEHVKLVVPIDFRLRGDITGLDETRPVLRVRVECVPHSEVILDGKQVPLDEAGRGASTLDVTAALSEVPLKATRLDRQIPYSVRAGGSEVRTGLVRFSMGITPLSVEAPGSSIVVDSPNFMLAGRTVKSASVTVGDRPLTVHSSGQFEQLMNVSTEGETTIVLRASAPDLAPRLWPVHVRRVARLEDEAPRFPSDVVVQWRNLASETSAPGSLVHIEGTLAETRTEGYTTSLLLEGITGCESSNCLAKLVYGAQLNLSKGTALSVYGTYNGQVDGPRSGTRIPEIRVDFVLKNPKH